MNFETFYKKRSSRRCLGGRGVAQVRTCAVGFPPDSGREPGFLRRKPEERAPGAVPLDPQLHGPLATRSLVLAWWGAAKWSIGYYEPHVRTLIWRLSFAKCFFSIFFHSKMRPKSVLGYRTK